MQDFITLPIIAVAIVLAALILLIPLTAGVAAQIGIGFWRRLAV